MRNRTLKDVSLKILEKKTDMLRGRGRGKVQCLVILLMLVHLPFYAYAVVSDDFNNCELDFGLWTLVDPLDDALVYIEGAGTGDSKLHFSIPGGPDHDAWKTNTAPRLLQSVDDTDFFIEIKFDSSVKEYIQDQGIVIQESGNRFLRFDFYYDGSSTRIFAASLWEGNANVLINQSLISGPIAPLYMRVQRIGDNWIGWHSSDGKNWTEAARFNYELDVAAMGPYIGNYAGGSGNAPAHTAVIDYFFDASAPIEQEDVGAVFEKTVLDVEVIGLGTVNTDPKPDLFGCGDVVTLTAIPDKGYLFSGWSGDLKREENPVSLVMSRDKSLTATFVIDASGIVSDDFNQKSLNKNLWSLINPRGDAIVSTVGVGTGQAQLQFSIPGGPVHDLWKTNTAPRLLQPINDTDFGIEVKFDSPVEEYIQDQGIVIEEGDNHFLRFDFYYDGSSTRIFSASLWDGNANVVINQSLISGSIAPLYMRVHRIGDNWIGRYSYDGENWIEAARFNYEMNVTAVGPYVGNAGSPSPAHTALIDYFFNISNPIEHEDAIHEITIEDILEYFYDGVANGDIVGSGDKRWRKRIKLWRLEMMLKSAKWFLKKEKKRSYCRMLRRCYRRSNGLSKPRALIEGAGVVELANMIDEARINMDCH